MGPLGPYVGGGRQDLKYMYIIYERFLVMQQLLVMQDKKSFYKMILCDILPLFVVKINHLILKK